MKLYKLTPLVLAFTLAIALALVPVTAWAATDAHVVRVPAGTDLGALELAAATELDYGSFRWLELGSTEYQRLVDSGLPFTEVADAHTVQVLDYRFDPLVQGEPTVPVDLLAGDGGLALVQFRGPVRQQWLDTLVAQGAKPLQYYPHNTYLLWAPASATTSLARLDFVRWQGAFHPAYKLSPTLQGHGERLDKLQVIFVDDGDVDATALEIARIAGAVERLSPAQPDRALWSAVLEADAAVLEDLARIPTVLWMGYKSPSIQLEDEMSSQIVAGNHPAGVPALGYNAHLASLGVDGTGVTWVIADTGVDYDHPDLGSRIVGGFSVTGTACNPPGQPGSDCSSPGGHGTHVAGIVGGDASGGFTDGDGFLYGLGVAPNYSIFALNIFGSGGDLPDFSQQGVLAGATGSNNSWTTGEGTAHGYQASERTYDLMVRDGDFDTMDVAEPHTVVFSAGNSGPGAMTLTAPKEAKNVIVTAGTQNYRTTSNIDSMYVFSSRGPAVDGRYVPTIAAPGQTIASTRNDLGGSCASAISGTDGLYAFCTGTSMAAPQTSGALALATEWWRGFNGGADPSPAMSKALLINTAVDISSTGPIPNFDEGWGRIQITNIIDPAVNVVYFDQDELLDATGQSWTGDVEPEDDTLPLKVSLTWTDAPGALGANPALVNNLDLTVMDGLSTFLGNQFTLGWSSTGGVADTLNNLENVFIQNPSGGLATVTVDATAINGDGVPYNGDATDQDFALVCWNCRLSVFRAGFEGGNTSEWTSVVSDG